MVVPLLLLKTVEICTKTYYRNLQSYKIVPVEQIENDPQGVKI